MATQKRQQKMQKDQAGDAEKMAKTPILLGNTFSLTLVNRPVRIEPIALDDLRGRLVQGKVCSFWGHANTLAAANQILARDVTPVIERPALELSKDGLPCLDGVEFSECYVLTPQYRPGFRPAIGVEVTSADIVGWQALKITWLDL